MNIEMDECAKRKVSINGLQEQEQGIPHEDGCVR